MMNKTTPELHPALHGLHPAECDADPRPGSDSGGSTPAPEGMYRNCRGTWVTKPRVHPRACEMCGKSAYPGQDMVQVPRTHQRKLCPSCLPLKRAANSQRLRGPSEPKAFLDAMRGPRVTKDRAVPEDSRDHAQISWSSLKPSFFPSVDEWDEDFAK